MIRALLVVVAGCGGTTEPAAQPDSGGETSVDAPSAKGFTSGPPLPRAWQEHAVVTTSAGLYVLGGFSPLKVASDVPLFRDSVWGAAPDMPAERHHVMATTIGDDVYVLGGMTGLDFTSQKTAWVLRAGKWESLPDLPEARGAGGAAAVDGVIYVVGGMLAGETRSEVFALDKGAWRSAAPLKVAREHESVVAFEGRVYAIAGRRGTMSTNLASVEIYDPKTNVWTDGPPLPRATGGCAAVVHQGKIYVLGGEAPDVASDELDAMDPKTMTWSVVARTPKPRHGLGIGSVGAAIVIPGGGIKPGFGAVADVDLYVP
jgi:hypothetical protein